MKDIHPSHETKLSDSSLYDERCVKCGASDGRHDTRLFDPCPNTPQQPDKADTSAETTSIYCKGCEALMKEGQKIAAERDELKDLLRRAIGLGTWNHDADFLRARELTQ